MARITVSGIDIDYELKGPEGSQTVVLTPGGRFERDTPGLPQLGDALAAAGKRVLHWDRPSCGASDISFNGESESALHADTLVGLVKALDLGKVVIAGGSAGSRISLMATARMPDQVTHLLIWWISGDPISLATLAMHYCASHAILASRYGMEGVLKHPDWQLQLKRNPKNRDILLSQDPAAFIEKMQQWSRAYTYSDESPVPGMAAADFGKLTMPTLVFRSGLSDVSHTRKTSDWVHDLIPHSEYVDPPWPDTEWNDRSEEPQEAGRFNRWPLLAPQLLEFINR